MKNWTIYSRSEFFRLLPFLLSSITHEFKQSEYIPGFFSSLIDSYRPLWTIRSISSTISDHILECLTILSASKLNLPPALPLSLPLSSKSYKSSNNNSSSSSNYSYYYNNNSNNKHKHKCYNSSSNSSSRVF